MSEYTKGKIYINTLNDKLPIVREFKQPYGQASHFSTTIMDGNNRIIFKINFGYGHKNDKANTERLVLCWNAYDRLKAKEQNHDDLLKACEGQHEAIDRLFAMLISANLKPTFYPSKSGQPWEALVMGNQAIKKAPK